MREMLLAGIDSLQLEDAQLYDLLTREYERQKKVLTLVAASSIVHPSVLACEGATLVNVTAEGYPGARYHAGCEVVDEVERLAIARAKAAFGAKYANVQPRSATAANQIVMCGLLNAGDTILGMDLGSGGHLSHGSPASLSGQYFNAINYGVLPGGEIDYEGAQKLAREHRPRLIVCGTTSYPGIIDFKRFREIADDVGAILLADITHIAGLVAAGLHPSPIDQAHVTTTCTHKQLYGPRGGLILMGRDHDTKIPGRSGTLAQRMQKAVFPLFHGAPNLNEIAAKARGLAIVAQPSFKVRATRIAANAKSLAAGLVERGHTVVGGGTANHLVVVDVTVRGLTGAIAEKALELSGIIVNKNRLANDTKPAAIGSGIRLGTNGVALKEFGAFQMMECADLITETLDAVRPDGNYEFILDECIRKDVKARVEDLCLRFPTPDYP